MSSSDASLAQKQRAEEQGRVAQRSSIRRAPPPGHPMRVQGLTVASATDASATVLELPVLQRLVLRWRLAVRRQPDGGSPAFWRGTGMPRPAGEPVSARSGASRSRAGFRAVSRLPPSRHPNVISYMLNGGSLRRFRLAFVSLALAPGRSPLTPPRSRYPSQSTTHPPADARTIQR